MKSIILLRTVQDIRYQTLEKERKKREKEELRLQKVEDNSRLKEKSFRRAIRCLNRDIKKSVKLNISVNLFFSNRLTEFSTFTPSMFKYNSDSEIERKFLSLLKEAGYPDTHVTCGVSRGRNNKEYRQLVIHIYLKRIL